MWKPQLLPINKDIETKTVLKKLPFAHKALAELKGIAETIPNQIILLNTISLQEAKDSSEVENIITTQDELFRAELQLKKLESVATKEVQNYASALKRGFELVKQHELLTSNYIIEIQTVLEKNNGGYRKVPGTALKNEKTGEIVYEPPQSHAVIVDLMKNLEKFINDNDVSDWDPIVKMAVIHFQFESIHPFYDGNGRTGRIINILYLIQQKLMNLPILYLSRYINQYKTDYYKYIQDVRDNDNWEDWLIYMIDAVEKTALQTIEIIKGIRQLMQDYKVKLRNELPKIYSQDLLNNMFKHPYTKIEFVEKDLQVSRITATKYLDKLVDNGFLVKEKMGRSNFYMNIELVKIFTRENKLEKYIGK